MEATMTDSYRELRALAPYLQLHRDKTFVVKLGGELLTDKVTLAGIVDQLALLNSLGVNLVLVHGGAPQIASLCRELGLKVETVAGRRITPPGVLRATAMALLGGAQLELLAALRTAGVSAVGLSGASSRLIEARLRSPLTLEVDGKAKEIDFGEVGEIMSVNGSLLRGLLELGSMPVVAPIGCSAEGRLLNINADTVAASIAAALGANKIIFLMQVPGILRDADNSSTLISELSQSELAELEARGVLRGGMLPKAAAANAALAAGVPRAHFVSGVEPEALLRELLSNEGSGTMVTSDA
jgi:acetylglutamate kinase